MPTIKWENNKANSNKIQKQVDKKFSWNFREFQIVH